MRSLVVVIGLCAIAEPTRARADDDVTGVVFVAQPVRAPVALDKVMPLAPFVPAGTPERAGDVQVAADRAAALWLDPLEVIRVRHGANDKLHFARVAGAGATRARLAEPGLPMATGVTYLSQPPGRGDVWMIWADAPATIRVERPIARDGRLIWDQVHKDVVDWVDAGGARPAIPIADGAYDAALVLEADAQLGAAIEAAYPQPAVKRAVRAWRKAGAIAALTAVRPLVEPQLAVTPLDSLAGMSGDVTVPDPTVPDPRPYHHVTGPKRMDVTLEGPGLLRVEVRAVLPAPSNARAQTEPPTVAVAIATGGRELGRRQVAAAYASTPDATNPPPAFPTKEPLRANEGDYLGDRIAVSIALFPGKHTYTIDVAGGALAVRATAARRRVRLGEAVGGRDDVDRFMRAAQKAIGDDRSDGAQLVRALLAARGGAPAGALPKGKLPPLLALARLAYGAPGKDVLAAIKAAPAGIATWTLVLELARKQPDGDVRALYRAANGPPPPSMVPDLVALLPRSTPLEQIRSWSLAALDVAWRARPTDPALADAVRAQWRTGEWQLVFPATSDAEAEPPQPRRWLVEEQLEPMQMPRTWERGDLVKIGPDKPLAITALPSAIDPARAALVDVYVTTPADDPGPIDLAVDGERFQSLALSPVEQLEVAVAPGRHQVKLGGSAKLVGWVSQLPAGTVAVTDTARVRSYWPPTVEGTRVSYALPAGELPIPIEVSLRAVGDGKGPISVKLHGDVGEAMQLELVPGTADATAHPLDAGAAASDEASFVVRMPPHTTVVWFETKQKERVVASVRARREAAPPLAAATGAAVDADNLVERVAKASKMLASDPDNARALARRASDLLDLGEVGLAREDLVRLLEVPANRRDAALAGLEEELFARLDDFVEPTHVALATGVPKTPVIVAPALLAVTTGAKLAPWMDAARALRAGKPDDALRLVGERSDPVGAAIAARARQAKDDPEGAALELLRARTDKWPVGLEAVDLLAQAIVDRKHPPKAGSIALTYGVAARVREALDHPRLRRALVVAAAQSGWDTITATSTSAGQEHLLSSAPILPPAPAVVVREALVAPAWPVRAGNTLTSGNAAVLDVQLDGAAKLFAQIHCVRVRKLQQGDGCALTARLDNGTAKPLAVPLGKTTEIALDPVPTGRHVVEVALAAASEGDAASVRFVSERALSGLTLDAEGGRYPFRIERRSKVFVASAATPVTTTVAGPTTLWVQLRAMAGAAGRAPTAEIVATPKKGEPIKVTVQLSADRDGDARADGNRDLYVAGPSDTFLVLPDAGAYAISIRPDKGELVARMALRDERRAKIPKLPGPWYAAAPPPAAPFTVPTPATSTIDAEAFAPPDTGSLGTLSFEASASQEARADEDVSDNRVFGRAETSIAWRRALVPLRVWVAARGLVRQREETALIQGGSADLYASELLFGTTLHVTGTAFTQRFADGQAIAAHGVLRITRPWEWSDATTALPGLDVTAAYLNTDPAVASGAGEQIDPDVYSDYRYSHPRDLTARFGLRWQPLQDMQWNLQASGTSTADFTALDHASAAIGVRTLLPLPLLGETELEFGYQPSFWLSNDDRMENYLRHDIAGRIEWSLWTGTQGRFVLALWDDVILEPGFNRNAAGLGLRFDLVRHRGLADFQPDESLFSSLVERRLYAPLEPR